MVLSIFHAILVVVVSTMKSSQLLLVPAPVAPQNRRRKKLRSLNGDAPTDCAPNCGLVKVKFHGENFAGTGETGFCRRSNRSESTVFEQRKETVQQLQNSTSPFASHSVGSSSSTDNKF